MILFGEVITTRVAHNREAMTGVCSCVVFTCQALLRGQLQMVIPVQNLKVAKGQKRGAASVWLTHFLVL